MAEKKGAKAVKKTAKGKPVISAEAKKSGWKSSVIKKTAKGKPVISAETDKG